MEPARAVITHNVVPMRAAPDGSAEQVSQAILGDSVLLLEEREDYARIQTRDEYEGWALRRHVRLCQSEEPVPPSPGDSLDERYYRVTSPIADFRAPLDCGENGRLRTKLVFGTMVAEAEGGRPQNYWEFVQTMDGQRGYIQQKDILCAAHYFPFSCHTACGLAQQFIGTPYLWGGTTPFGFDCSGFVQRIYGMFGVNLPRDAYLQATSPLGDRVPDGEPLQAGDLVFFCGDSDPRGRGITHVGMALDAGRFLHASGKEGVAITPLDDPYYVRAFHHAWRYRP